MISTRTLALLLIVAPLCAARASAHQQSESTDSPPEQSATTPADEPSVERLTQQVRESVVVVTSSGRDGRREGMGAGFVVSDDGLIATNFHVIGQGRGIRVQLADGREADVTAVHASDRQLDLAVLRIDAADLKPLALGSSDDVKQGQPVIAVGNPQGLKHSVVSGVVSGVREVEGREMIQLAMPIEPGNSGGPLVDMQGRVQGLLTMKSLVTRNLGFALSIDLLKPLLAKPNPIPMSRWMTIGALDPGEWQPVFGARWRQRAGRITVEGLGRSFGGRSLCLSGREVPARPFELSVTVRLDDEAGAAGLAFCSDGTHRHYGFYPSGGHLRFTRFAGPDIRTWSILYDRPSRHYNAGGWNTLRVRLEDDRILCFVNDEPVVEMADSSFGSGRVGLVKFRGTKAQFKNFQLGSELPRAGVTPGEMERIGRLVEGLDDHGAPNDALVRMLSVQPERNVPALRRRAAMLENQARQLRRLAGAAHERHVTDELVAALALPDEQIDLFRAGLLVARLDNEEVDVDAYCEELAEMADELAAAVPADADDEAKLEALRQYLFEENGFHGSRGDYYHRANSYLNEVLDDREGLPITLAVVYMELARRIDLDVVGVGLPGHFVVAHVPDEGERQLIDVFDAAAPITRAEAERRVNEATEGSLSAEQMDDAFEPVAKRDILFRMLTNLLGLARGNPRDLHRYLNAMLAIEPDNGPYHWLRAMVRYELDDRRAARADVEWLLEHEPEGVNLDQVRALKAELERE